MASHPEIMSSVFPIEEFKKDYQLYKDLAPIAAVLETLDVYSAVKQNADRVPGLKVVADEMSTFFTRPRKKAESAKA
jgi:hypothetical protein